MDWIFYPSINYERQEDSNSPNHYNCPIVATYPEVIAGNMDDIFQENQVTFSHPFLPYDNDAQLEREPVSYTHLDVYKRQTPSRVCSSAASVSWMQDPKS